MVRRRKNGKLSRAATQRLLSTSNRGWILDPVLSERDEWTECVRTKRQHEEEELEKNSEPDEASEDFDD